MSKGYERWHCVAGHGPGLTCSLYQSAVAQSSRPARTGLVLIAWISTA